MLDIVIANGRVVTPQGAGAWDIGIKGEQIAALGLPGTLPRDGARVIDAAGQIVTPGGHRSPHAPRARASCRTPTQPSATLGPEDDTRGMACGGTTTHIDFGYVRPGVDDIQAAIEQRAARWKGNSLRRLRLPHHARRGAADPSLRPDPRGDPGGLPELQGLHHQRAAAASQARRATASTSGASATPWRRSRRRAGIMVVHGEDEDLVQFNYERFRAEGRMDGTQPAPRPHQALGAAGVPAHGRRWPGRRSAAVYFVHTSAKEGVETIGEARGQRPAGLRRDAAPVRVLQRRVLQDAARLLLAHLSRR